MKNNYFICCIVSLLIILYFISKNKKFCKNINIKGGKDTTEKNWFKSEDKFNNLTDAVNLCHSKNTNLLNSRTDVTGEAIKEDSWYRNDYGYSNSVGVKSGIKNQSKRLGSAICKNLKQTDLELGDLEILKNITQTFNDITHIQQFVDKKFNYNEFELSFSINRINKMVIDLEGGILTIGPNNSNYHNLFIYLRQNELMIGLMGYNTNISINLQKIKTAVTIHFRFIYKNPYLNIFVNAIDNEEQSTSGYLDYLGNISNKMNTNFRLYLHPFLNSWCSLGTVNFIKMKEEIIEQNKKELKPNLSSAEGILNQEETTLSNLKISHKKRDLKELYDMKNIEALQNFSLNYNIKNTIVFDFTLNTNNIDKNGTLIRMDLANSNYLELQKINKTTEITSIILVIKTDLITKSILEIDYIPNKKIYNGYLEIIPYMDVNLLCLYLNNDFYRYVINLSDLKIKNIYPNFVNSTINIGAPLIGTIKIFTEEFKYMKGSKLQKLYPMIEFKKNETLIKFQKNVKIEYVKLRSNNNMIYTLFLKNHFENNWKNILSMEITKKNKNKFKDRNIIINDNRISNEYKLEMSTHEYYLIPRFILGKNNSILSENTDKKILSYVEDQNSFGKGTGEIKLVDGLSDGTKWTMRYLMENDFEIKTKITSGESTSDYYFYLNNNNRNNVPTKLIVEGKPNTRSFYISYIDKTDESQQYIYFSSRENTKGEKINELKHTTNKENCEFTLKQFIPPNDVIAKEDLEKSKELKAERINELNEILKKTEDDLKKNENEKNKNTNDINNINKKIKGKLDKITNLNKNIDDFNNQIFDLNKNIREINYINETEVAKQRTKINELLNFVEQDKFKDKNFFYSDKNSDNIKSANDATAFCEKYKTNLMNQSRMNDSLTGIWGYYSEGVGIKTGKTPKEFFKSPTGSPNDYYHKLIKKGHECKSSDTRLGSNQTVDSCAQLCDEKTDCKFFVYGYNNKICYQEKTSSSSCPEGWLKNDYNFYENVSFSTRAIAVCDKLKALQNLKKIEREIREQENSIKSKKMYNDKIKQIQGKIQKIEKEIEIIRKEITSLEDSKMNLESERTKFVSTEKSLTFKKKMTNINITNEENTTFSTELIEFYGIEDPYPKLYIDDNNIKQSTQPCSYVHSDENIIFEHLPSKIIFIEDKFEETENENFNKMEKLKKDDQTTSDNKKNKNLPDCTEPANKIVCDIIRGNMYENSDNELVNKIYNFCSNNLNNYNNKLYAYQYSNDRYYYQDDNDYEKKRRLKLAELTKLELEQVRHIKKLKDGVDLISVNTNKKLVNPKEDDGCTKKYCLKNQVNDLFELFSNEIQNFKIKWSDDSAFKSTVLIHLIAPGYTDKYVKNFKIIDDVFSDISMEKYVKHMRTNLVNKFKNNIKQLKDKKPYLKFNEWGKHPPGYECPMDMDDRNWDDPPPKTCCDPEDDCNVISLSSYKPTVCKKISEDSIKKRIEKSNLLILKKLDNILKIYHHSNSGLLKWNNLTKFIENNFTKDDIYNNSQYRKLFYSYKSLISTRINIALHRKRMIALLRALNSGRARFFRRMSFGGKKPRLKNYYKKYFKNPSNFIKDILEKVIEEENEIIRNEDKGFNNLTELYMYKKIPKFEYHDSTIDGTDKREYWRLEWDGLYNPDLTEFQLFSLLEKKYLISEDNKLIWSEKKKWGSGWKIKPALGGTDNEEEIEKKRQAYQIETNKIVYNEINNKFKKNIEEELKISDDNTDKGEIAYKKAFEKQLDDIRKEEIMSLNKNAWLFSPNIGKYGEFLISTPISKKQKWMDFGGRDFKKYKFKLVLWSDEGPVYDKPFDQENKTIAIARQPKGKGIEFLRNTLHTNTNAFEWVGEDKWSSALKWELEWDKKLEVNLNTMKTPQPLPGELEILSKYKLVSNKKITITVGNRINQISGIIPWQNEFMAVKDAEQKGFYGCIDYAWIAEEDGKVVYYDDDYSDRGGKKNTLTRCWFVMDREKSITEKYLAANKLAYELFFAKWYSYKKCFRRRHIGYGRYRCADMRYVTWNEYGWAYGLNSWKGRQAAYPPSGNWTARQNEMLEQLEDSSGGCIQKINKPMTVYLKSPSKGYLRSDTFGKPLFAKDIKKPYVTGWHILMKYPEEKKPQWLKNHKNQIKSYKNYYTKIFSKKTCTKSKAVKLKIPKNFLSSSTFSVADCAQMFRDWQLMKGDKYRWFMYLPKDNNFNNQCWAIETEDQCDGFQRIQNTPPYVTIPAAFSSFFGSIRSFGGASKNLNENENENEISNIHEGGFGLSFASGIVNSNVHGYLARRIAIPQYTTYKLDDQYDSS